MATTSMFITVQQQTTMVIMILIDPIYLASTAIAILSIASSGIYINKYVVIANNPFSPK